MKKVDYALLAALQLCIMLLIARHQTIPGNIDADYYFMGGLRLAQGHGFTENYIWNYFSDPAAIPQPSHAYWMPLASILTAFGMWVTGDQSFATGRLAFILLAVVIPPLTAALSYRITSRRNLAIVTGLISTCSGFYLPYLPVTENYGVFMVLGALYFLNLDRAGYSTYFFLGLISGLMSLARSDGMLWLFLTFLLVLFHLRDGETSILSKPKLVSLAINLSLVLSGFLLIMVPWYLRNIHSFGTPMSLATRRALWLTEYYQTFMYPANQLTSQNWLASGWSSIIQARLFAIQRILYNMAVVQCAFLLLPFTLLGLWSARRDQRVKMGVIAWGLLIFVFTMFFPLASARGTYIHAVSAVQPLLWAVAVLGLDSTLQYLHRWPIFQLKGMDFVFQSTFVLVMALISFSSVNALVLENGWQRGELKYPEVERFLVQHGIMPSEAVMVTNPPGYTMMTNRPAVMYPYGDIESVLGVARRFNAPYIAIRADTANTIAHYNLLYSQPDLYPNIKLLGEVDDIKVFQVTIAP